MPLVVLRGPHGVAVVGSRREEDVIGTVLQLERRVPDVARPGAVGPGDGVPLESAVWEDLEPAALLVAVADGDGVPGPPSVGLVISGVQGRIMLQGAVAVVVREGLGLIGRGRGGQGG